MELDALVSSFSRGARAFVAFVGAGGKTTTMFALARRRAVRGTSVLVSTTTRILDPEAASEREGKAFGHVLRLADPASPESLERIRAAGSLIVLGSPGDAPDGPGDSPKLLGVYPDCLEALARIFDLVLVEADGSRGLPIKAPAAHEPVVPSSATVVIGVIGLDALGAPLDGRVAHRPELLGPLVGCAAGEPIEVEHIVGLAASSQGLFKGSPAGAARIVLLNKADLVSAAKAEACASALRAACVADAVLVGSLIASSVDGGAA
jgi:probable selenium-dependent hydroxylase accessory protein YqeC